MGDILTAKQRRINVQLRNKVKEKTTIQYRI